MATDKTTTDYQPMAIDEIAKPMATDQIMIGREGDHAGVMRQGLTRACRAVLAAAAVAAVVLFGPISATALATEGSPGAVASGATEGGEGSTTTSTTTTSESTTTTTSTTTTSESTTTTATTTTEAVATPESTTTESATTTTSASEPAPTETAPTVTTTPDGPSVSTAGDQPQTAVSSHHESRRHASADRTATKVHVANQDAAAEGHRRVRVRRGHTTTSTGAFNNVAVAPLQVAASEAGLEALLSGGRASSEALDYYRIPLFLLPIYQAASIQYGVPWQILAAINEVETDYGNDLGVSTAGAVGWMQFMPQTWLQYGVDALDAGYADPYNPVDAIFAAARYLHAAGASSDLKAAIFAYNHSDAYVASVLLRARLISDYPRTAIATLTGLADGRPPVEHGKVVAVADGTILAIGHSTALGDYVIERDVYGDVFTYAQLGHLASTYRPLRLGRADSAPEILPAAHEPKPTRPATGGYPGGDAVTTTGAATGSSSTATLGSRARSLVAHVLDGKLGEVSLFGGARFGVTSSHRRHATANATSRHRGLAALRRGSVVTAGTVLGDVDRAGDGPVAGHLRFSIAIPTGQSIEAKPILRAWRELWTTLHPVGAEGASPLLGATAGDVFLLSDAQLRSDVVSDPDISLSSCAVQEIQAGRVDRRVLAALAFLSRSGLRPTVGGLGCATGSDLSTSHPDDAFDIRAINGIAVADHQGPDSITAITIRTLATLQGSHAPERIISLHRYSEDPTTIASGTSAKRIRVVFSRKIATVKVNPSATASIARSDGSSHTALSPTRITTDQLSARQWDRLIARIATLPIVHLSTARSWAATIDPPGLIRSLRHSR